MFQPTPKLDDPGPCPPTWLFLDHFFGENICCGPFRPNEHPQKCYTWLESYGYPLYDGKKRKTYFVHPVKRQIFDAAPGRTFYLTWDCVIHAGALVWLCHCRLPGQLVCMQRMNPLILRVSGKDSPHELWYPHLCTSLLATLCVRKDGILRNWDSSFDSQGLEEGFWTVAIMQKKARGQLPTRRYRSQRCS